MGGVKLLAFLTILVTTANSSPQSDPRKDRWHRSLLRGHDDPTPLMIAKAGYDTETHIVTTADCYILEMHRIPRGRDGNKAVKERRPPILLQHGLLSSSADFVMNGPGKALAFILADAGFDVWLGNIRGNTYSRNHCSMDPDDVEFWDFSWDEMGKFDLPAMIDQILLMTSAEKIHYVGHSMGTTMFMAMTNLRPEYQDKIIMANFLAPVAYVEHMQSPIRYIAPFAGSIDWVLEHLGIGEFLPSNWLMDQLAEVFCDEDSIPAVCTSIVFLFCGYDKPQLNVTMMDTIIHHTPAGASVNSLLHYAQEVSSGRFCAFDRGQKGNMEVYGQPEPPEYDIGKITTPIAVYWGNNDWLAHTTDVLRLTSQVKNLVVSYEVPYDGWNHLDFMWGIDAPPLVYEEVLKQVTLMDAKTKLVPA